MRKEEKNNGVNKKYSGALLLVKKSGVQKRA